MRIITIIIMLLILNPIVLFSQSSNANTKPIQNAEAEDSETKWSYTVLFGGTVFNLYKDGGPISIKLFGVNYSITEEYTEWIISIYGGISSPGFFAYPGILGNIEYRIFGTSGYWKPYIGFDCPVSLPFFATGIYLNLGLLSYDFGKSPISSLEVLVFGIGIGTTYITYDGNKKKFPVGYIYNIDLVKLTF